MGVRIQVLVETFLDLLAVLAVQHLVLQIRQLVGDLRVRLHIIIVVERDHLLGAALRVLVHVQVLVQVLHCNARKVKK